MAAILSGLNANSIFALATAAGFFAEDFLAEAFFEAFFFEVGILFSCG